MQLVSSWLDETAPGLSRRKETRFLLESAPVWAPILACPTLADAPSDIRKALLHLCYSDSAIGEGCWWVVATNWVVHFDSKHKWQNLAALLSNGFNIWETFGKVPFLSVFFGAAVFSSSFALGVHAQNRANFVKDVPLAYMMDWIGASSFVDVISSSYSHRVQAAGASGGICALGGCGLCINLHWLYSRIQMPYITQTQTPPYDIICNLLLDGSAFGRLLIVYQQLSFITADVFLLASGDHVGHAQHLSGSLFGITSYFLLSYLYRNDRGPSGGLSSERRWGAGRRLGQS